MPSRIQHEEALAAGDHAAAVDAHTEEVAGLLDDLQEAIRIGTELRRVVVERRSYTAQQALEVLRVSRVNEDLDVDVFPAFAMHRVVGGEEDVHAVDRNVADIMEVAAPRFAPRATQLARRNRYLIGVGADDRFECRRSVRRHVRIDVAKRRRG